MLEGSPRIVEKILSNKIDLLEIFFLTQKLTFRSGNFTSFFRVQKGSMREKHKDPPFLLPWYAFHHF